MGSAGGASPYFLALYHTSMKAKKICASLILASFLMNWSPVSAVAADSDLKGRVVINEIAWMGSLDSANDEWLELYNTGDAPLDLTGWKIIDDATGEYRIETGTIPAKGYFLIEDTEAAVANVAADAVIGLSLANSGDSLELRDANGATVDVVNAIGGAWYAGDAAKGASMERKFATADEAANWQTALAGSGAQASKGSAILGTPKAVNSVSLAGTALRFELSPVTVKTGDAVQVVLKSDRVADLFSYGFDILYDAAALEFKSAEKGSLLNYFANENTAFQSGFLAGEAGRLVVGEARTVRPKTGVSGEGELLRLNFKVIAKPETATTISVEKSKSFLANAKGGELPFTLSPLKIMVAGLVQNLGTPQNLLLSSLQRYELKLAWQPVAGADAYKVYRKGVDGTFLEIATVKETEFVDKDGVEKAGNILAKKDYYYQVVAISGDKKSEGAEVFGQETRGIKADINRDDRVDGRDLNALAQVYGLDITFPEYSARADLNYDGDINGSDLIDLGVDWAKVYQPQANS